MPSTLVNGEPVSSLAIQESSQFSCAPLSASVFGDGVFETMLMRDGMVPLLAGHRARLNSGMKVLGLGRDADFLNRDLATLIDHYKLGQGIFRVKLTVTRQDLGRGYSTKGVPVVRVITAYPYKPDWDDDIELMVSPVRLTPQPLLAGIKHCNRLEQILAKRAQRRGSDDSLMLDLSGNAIETISSNLFILEAGRLVTPILENCGVAGVMRDQIMEVAAPQMAIRVSKENITLSRLVASDGVIICNALCGVTQVAGLSLDAEFSEMAGLPATKNHITWSRNKALIGLQHLVQGFMFPNVNTVGGVES